MESTGEAQASRKKLVSKTFTSSITEGYDGQSAAPQVRPQTTKNGRSKTLYDGKKLILEGSSTRNERNWESTVFSSSKIEKSKRRPLNKPDHGKANLFGDEPQIMQRRDEYKKAGFNRKSMTELEMLPKNYSATKRS